VVVIVARKPDQCEILLGEERLIVEGRTRPPEPATGKCRLVGMPQHDPGFVASPERHPDATPDGRRGAVRGEIVERARERHIDGNLQNQGLR
jgi:hypothetical protein